MLRSKHGENVGPFAILTLHFPISPEIAKLSRKWKAGYAEGKRLSWARGRGESLTFCYPGRAGELCLDGGQAGGGIQWHFEVAEVLQAMALIFRGPDGTSGKWTFHRDAFQYRSYDLSPDFYLL